MPRRGPEAGMHPIQYDFLGDDVYSVMMPEIVTSLSIRYDDCRRPRWGAPAAVLVNENKKNPCPAVPRRGPEAGVHQVEYDFFGSDVKSLYSVMMPEIVTLLSIGYDNCPRPRWGAPATV